MANKPVAELVIPVTKRTKGTLTLKRPAGSLQAVSVDVYVRAGSEENPQAVGEQPVGVFQDLEIPIPANLLKSADEVAVEASFVLKQPAGLTGTIKLAASLEVAGQKDDTHITVQLKDGQTGGLHDLTFWVIT